MTYHGVGAEGAGGRLGDIIDLDRYMRAAVRRSTPETTDDEYNERLVVDCGGVKAGSRTGANVGAAGGARAYHKRYSHDSGLSDSSYKPRTRRAHRRSSPAEGGNGKLGRESRDTRLSRAAAGSSNSLREFRAVCERALLDQQQQLTRVTQLCERLTAPVVPPHEAESSELSSSSCSTKDQRRKDKHRANECKTYKIIMNKLDELNRLFATRGHSRTGPTDAAPHRQAHSSCSASVSDKLVAAVQKRNVNQPSRIVQANKQVDYTRGSSRAGSGVGSPDRCIVRAVTQAYALNIAPADVMAAVTPRSLQDRPNVTTESIVERGSMCEEFASSACDPRCGFDLDDPVHLYAQAKRLQTLHATTRRSKSAGYEALRGGTFDERLDKQFDKQTRARHSSMCALCRSYWRALWRYIGAQLTGTNV